MGDNFIIAGGKEFNYIARWDGTWWSPLGSGTGSYVYALTEFNGELIAGGGFITAGGQVSAYFARWGLCSPKEECPADLDGNGVVNTIDLLILFANWG